MSLLETVAVILSIAYTILAIKENVWCWLMALISVSIYFYILIDIKLYAESGLQVFYFLMALYGIYQWKFGDHHRALPLSKYSYKTHLLIILGGAVGVFLLSSGLIKYTNAALPVVDSFTTVFSIIATYMVTKKIVSNWLYWIIIDTVSIFMYYSRGFSLTAGLFVAYTLLAVWGYIHWKREYDKAIALA
jgi:nicotinamide mononucleotide transporter